MERYLELKNYFFEFASWYTKNKDTLSNDTRNAIRQLHLAWKKSTTETACANDFILMMNQHAIVNSELLGKCEPWDVYINKGLEFRLSLMLWFLEKKKNTF